MANKENCKRRQEGFKDLSFTIQTHKTISYGLKAKIKIRI